MIKIMKRETRNNNGPKKYCESAAIGKKGRAVSMKGFDLKGVWGLMWESLA